ncbi:MAG: hypothetical protein Q8O33_00910 [Pseudomonadota bacterium]|nr:hypothetical protein [Pseudomonadota bacterium]
MTTLAQHIAALATRIGQELKARVTPEHPGLARAWVSFGWEKSHATEHVVIHAGHNVKKVLRIAPGKYRVVFEVPMPDAHYCWLAFARNSGKTMKMAAARVNCDDKTTDDVELVCTTPSGTLADSSEINVVVYR